MITANRELDMFHAMTAQQMAEMSTCVRRKVGCIAINRHTLEVIAGGWNMERDGLCEKDCPRAQHYDVVPGVSSYEHGPTKCISIHAEDMCVRALRGMGISLCDVYLVVTHEPCYKCREMLEFLGVEWTLRSSEWLERMQSTNNKG